MKQVNKHTLYITRISESTHVFRIYYSICICGNSIDSFECNSKWIEFECHKCEEYYSIVCTSIYTDDGSGVLKA